jgi:hypothetical protein
MDKTSQDSPCAKRCQQALERRATCNREPHHERLHNRKETTGSPQVGTYPPLLYAPRRFQELYCIHELKYQKCQCDMTPLYPYHDQRKVGHYTISSKGGIATCSLSITFVWIAISRYCFPDHSARLPTLRNTGTGNSLTHSFPLYKNVPDINNREAFPRFSQRPITS